MLTTHKRETQPRLAGHKKELTEAFIKWRQKHAKIQEEITKLHAFTLSLLFAHINGGRKHYRVAVHTDAKCWFTV